MKSNINNVRLHAHLVFDGLTQYKMGKMYGTKIDTLQRIMSEELTEVRVNTLESIAAARHISVGRLFFEPDDEAGDAYADSGIYAITGNLQKYRTQAGYTLQEVSRKTGISERTCWAYEYGNCRPSLGRLQTLANLYNIEVADLFLY